MRISDWSSDVCSSDLSLAGRRPVALGRLSTSNRSYGRPTDRLDRPGHRYSTPGPHTRRQLRSPQSRADCGPAHQASGWSVSRKVGPLPPPALPAECLRHTTENTRVTLAQSSGRSEERRAGEGSVSESKTE